MIRMPLSGSIAAARLLISRAARCRYSSSPSSWSPSLPLPSLSAPPRFPWLRTATAADIAALRALLPGAGEVLSSCAGDDLSGYNTDWLRAHVGAAAAVLRPSSVAGVRAVR